ncbi:MAG: response regulator [Chloracidobacterium sp.]|nr:response regulator [Chloracidobacterium sp.]
METEWNLDDLNDKELSALGIGHLNLRNFDAGQKYLHQLLRRDPNNVILAAQLNTIAIRLDEINRQSEIAESKPKGKTILVVDDSATVRKLLMSKLEKSGHNVVCAVDGVDALSKMAETLPDMVFLDITMPRKDGYEVCKEIRSNPAAKNLPVVMISGKDGFFDKVRGKMAGANGYVTKPFGPDALMKALETHLVADNTVAEL